jgi:membrane protein
VNRQRLRTWAIVLRWWWSDVRLLFARTFQEFVDDHCSDIAAGLSYYVLFSIFPLVILAVSVTGVLLKDEALRGRVIHDLLAALPLTPGAGQRELQQVIEGVVRAPKAAGTRR